MGTEGTTQAGSKDESQGSAEQRARRSNEGYHSFYMVKGSLRQAKNPFPKVRHTDPGGRSGIGPRMEEYSIIIRI
jgi:hypothetical protein